MMNNEISAELKFPIPRNLDILFAWVREAITVYTFSKTTLSYYKVHNVLFRLSYVYTSQHNFPFDFTLLVQCKSAGSETNRDDLQVMSKKTICAKLRTTRTFQPPLLGSWFFYLPTKLMDFQPYACTDR